MSHNRQQIAAQKTAAETELRTILEKYSGTAKDDIEKAISLTKQLYGIDDSE